MILLALTVALQNPVMTPTIHDGGICAGISWITLASNEKVSVEQGPDFEVLRFEGPGGSEDRWWGVYSGRAAQVSGGKAILLSRDGVIVRRAEENGVFRGYVAERNGTQNHFFGSVLNGTPADKAFFNRIDFSPKGQMLCAKVSPQP